MNSWQLSCGCWVSAPEPHGIGDHYPCKNCDSLKTTIIGYAAFPSGVLAS